MDPNAPMKRHIKHVVYLMMENRSFDNLLGWLYDGSSAPAVTYVPDPSPAVKFQGLTAELLEAYAQPITYKLWGHDTLSIVRGVQDNYFPTLTPILDPQESFASVTAQLF